MRKPSSGSGYRLAEVEKALLSRWPEHRLDPTLERISAVMELLGNPQRRIPAIHVTGTNGKTTTARIADELLRSTGRKVGRYTSPHLTSIRERIVIDGSPIDADAFVAVYDEVLPAVEKVDQAGPVSATFFETVTAMALVSFARACVDAAVIEVGMGGSWDATNVVDGRVAVIAPISIDHTEYLGPDEVTIATEKAGIIKFGATVVLASQLPEAEHVLRERAANVGAKLQCASDTVRRITRTTGPTGQRLHLHGTTHSYPGLFLPLLGEHQADNTELALAAVEAFLEADGSSLEPAAARRALGRVSAPGRLEKLWDTPPVVVDASHNPAGTAASVAGLREALSPSRLVVVLAMLEGKDARGILEALSDASIVVVTENESPRRRAAGLVAETARDVLGPDRVLVEPRMDAAITKALSIAEPRHPDDHPVVLVTGSVVTAGQARSVLLG
ncbi:MULTISPECIES: folylpolyglutamate synthase/dihydrofolate synthase family protein [unclassified Mycobacterium]|uniref:bifunctional folylpolyglutamate synthase/dihydrofolate synthase n=1 Tax=unclassified Mycobacterium TaxID=2642494 RepID=UPI0029C87961|nr:MULTISPECIES: folylpolyglutamate synthase/dihydrofolate synthase family protein [unclassified Mycobacterium]